MQKVLNSTDVKATDKSEDHWQIVKGKNIGKIYDSTGSPKEMSPNDKNVQNRFLSLSNLEGDSNAPVEEIARTAALVMGSGEDILERNNSGTGTSQQKSLFSIHQLDKSHLPKLASKLKLNPRGVIIKEKPAHKNRSS